MGDTDSWFCPFKSCGLGKSEFRHHRNCQRPESSYADWTSQSFGLVKRQVETIVASLLPESIYWEKYA
jgi:hypothetical protein